MRFNRILLLQPQYPGSYYTNCLVAPIGLGIIAEILRLNGVDYEVADISSGYNPKDLIKQIKNYRPDAIGISMMTFRYRHHYSILEMIKEFQKDIKIIAGGPHVTAWKERVLEQCAAIDFGISREGEFIIAELCQGKELSTIKGLIYRNGNEIIFNGERELIADLDTIPFPKYEKFKLKKYGYSMAINTSRGCPYRCIFCQSCSMLGRRWRGRSAMNVTDEIQYWYDRGYGDFIIVDDNFTMNKKRIYDICDEIDSRNLKIQLDTPGVRVDLVDRDLLKMMKEAGFEAIAFGIEAGNNKVLDILKKGFTIEQAEQTVKDAIELGFDVKLYFLVGSPYETLQDVYDSVNFALRYPISSVNFGSLMPIPDTELMDWVKKEGRLLRKLDEYLNEFAEFERVPHFDAPGMTLEERKYALELTERIRIKIQNDAQKRYAYKRFARFGLSSKVMATLYVSKIGSILRRLARPIINIRKDRIRNIEKLKLVVAHINYQFFASSETFIYFYLSNFRRVHPICISWSSPILNSGFFSFPAKDCYSCLIEAKRYTFRWLKNVFCLHLIRPLWAKYILRHRHARLIHAHFGPAGWELLPLKRVLHLPLVTTFYGFDVAPNIKMAGPDWSRRRQELFDEGDLFLVEGPFMRQRLIDLGCPPEKVCIQRIAIKLNQIPFRPRKPKLNGRIIIMFAGRFCEKKGLMYALQAIQDARKDRRDIEFRIIGDGELAPQVQRFIRENTLEDCVRLLGFLKYGDYLREMQDADIFLHPSVVATDGDNEGGAPTVILEAQALGIPIVSTYHADIPNVTLPGKSALLVPQRDREALTQALFYILDHSERWEEMGRAGRNYVEKYHNIDLEVSALEDKYFTLLSSSNLIRVIEPEEKVGAVC